MKRLLQASVNYLPAASRSWIRHLPIVAPLQRWIVEKFLSDGAFVHVINAGPAAGLKFEVSLPLDKAIWAGTYELAFATAIVAGIRPGDVCYDIGGYRGYLAGAMARAGAASIHVFEPLPENQRALRRLSELNPSLPIEISPIAVGERDGVAQLQVMPDPSMAKIADSPFQVGVPAKVWIEVAIRSLDSLVEQGAIPPPDLIKIDVEGGEKNVLKGASRVLSNRRPRLFIEAHSAALAAECTQILSPLDYRIHCLDSETPNEQELSHLVCTPR